MSKEPQEGKITGLKFGDIIKNHWAGEKNPHRTGIFVKHSTSQGSKCIHLTDGKGDYWDLHNDNHSKTVKIGSIFDRAESRGIAKGQEELTDLCSIVEAIMPTKIIGYGQRVEGEGPHEDIMHQTFTVRVKDLHAVRKKIDAILSASQPQEIAGEGCEWESIGTGSYQYVPGCGGETHCGPVVGKYCCHCSKPIVIGGER